MSAENFYLINEEVRADKPYHYEACGLDNIYLLNGYEVIEHEGEEHVSVKNMEELHQEIGRYLVCERKTLGGKDIRFLRSTMSMTQTQLARALGTTAQTLARWEKQAVVIPDTAEKLLRVFYLLMVAPEEERQAMLSEIKRMVLESLERLDEIDEVSPPVARFELKESWREKEPDLVCA